MLQVLARPQVGMSIGGQTLNCDWKEEARIKPQLKDCSFHPDAHESRPSTCVCVCACVCMCVRPSVHTCVQESNIAGSSHHYNESAPEWLRPRGSRAKPQSRRASTEGNMFWLGCICYGTILNGTVP